MNGAAEYARNVAAGAVLMELLLAQGKDYPMHSHGFTLVVKQPLALLARLIERVPMPASLSLEGDVSLVDVQLFPGWTAEPTRVLPRMTHPSTAHFLMLPIDARTKAPLVQSVLPRIGIRRRIHHVQLAQNDERLFAAYDSFHPECVWIRERPWVTEEWVTTLVHTGILRSFARRVAHDEQV